MQDLATKLLRAIDARDAETLKVLTSTDAVEKAFIRLFFFEQTVTHDEYVFSAYKGSTWPGERQYKFPESLRRAAEEWIEEIGGTYAERALQGIRQKRFGRVTDVYEHGGPGGSDVTKVGGSGRIEISGTLWFPPFWDTGSTPEQLYEKTDFDETCRLIVADFEAVSSELFDYFARDPERLHRLEWRRFEELLEAIFRNQGYRTKLGPGRGDGGVDLRLIQKDSIGEIITLVQAKRYSLKNPIGLEAVAALYAVVEDERAHRGLLVTTSRYLPSARRFAQRQNRRLELADGEQVAKWCNDIVLQRKPLVRVSDPKE